MNLYEKKNNLINYYMDLKIYLGKMFDLIKYTYQTSDRDRYGDTVQYAYIYIY